MNIFGNPVETPITALQLFEPDASAVYTLDAVANLTQVPRRLIVVYFKHGLVSPVMDPACSGWYLMMRRFGFAPHEYLRTACGLNLAGIKLIMDLVREVERLREELNFRRGRI
jgi:hypothetical protein